MARLLGLTTGTGSPLTAACLAVVCSLTAGRFGWLLIGSGGLVGASVEIVRNLEVLGSVLVVWSFRVIESHWETRALALDVIAMVIVMT